MLGRAAGGGLDADGSTEASAPGGFAIVFVQPVSGGGDPFGNFGVGGRSWGLFGAEVLESGVVNFEGGGHEFGGLSKRQSPCQDFWQGQGGRVFFG